MSEENATITYNTSDGTNVGVIQGTGEVTIKDFFVYCKGGVPVLKLDAKFDFDGIDPDSHTFVMNLLLQQRMRLLGPTDEDARKWERENQRYKERKAEYEALPWYKRLFARRPWSFDPENSEQED